MPRYEHTQTSPLHLILFAVSAARSNWLDGWGIHYFPGRGIIYNLWGFDCVRVQIYPCCMMRLRRLPLRACFGLLNHGPAGLR